MKSSKIIYLDNAATTFPKPKAVTEAVTDFMTKIGASAGRSGHSLSIEAGRMVYEARERAANFFGLSDPLRIIFTNNATASINAVLYGFLKIGAKVVTSSEEHNSLMRPLRELEKRKNIRVAAASCRDGLEIDLDDLRRKSKGADLIACVHGENVTGLVNDISAVAQIARENGAALLIDAAQTAGIIDINMEESGVDFLCASGHKSLYGPQGTGILAIGPNIDYKKMRTLLQGGTGSRSEEDIHPDILPDKFEAGTGNYPGIAGLSAGLKWTAEKGVKNLYKKEKNVRNIMLEGLRTIPGIRLFASPENSLSTNVFSFIIENMSVSEAAFRLDRDYNIMSRAGLHCAPAVHRSLGTFPHGTVRFSPGVFITDEDALYAINALRELAACR